MTSRIPSPPRSTEAEELRRRARDKWEIADRCRDSTAASQLRREARNLEARARQLDSGTRYML